MRVLYQNVSFKFKDKTLIDNLSLNIESGEHLAVVGPSGIGKSTLINAIVGMSRACEGNIVVGEWPVNSHNIDKIRTQVSWLPQEYNFPIETANEILKLPFQLKANKDKYFDESYIYEMMKRFALSPELRFSDWNLLSGGEKQRFMLISVLQLKRSILLLDEPTSALDQTTKDLVSNYLKSLRHTTIIAITHDTSFSSSFDRVIKLNQE